MISLGREESNMHLLRPRAAIVRVSCHLVRNHECLLLPVRITPTITMTASLIVRIPLVMDDRELSGPMSAALAACSAFEVEVRRLAVGDYVTNSALVFERKTLADLADSIKQGRLFSQALRLTESRIPAALLLERTSRDLVGNDMRREAIQGALVMMSLFIGLPVLRSRNPAETLCTFLYAARQRFVIANGFLLRRSRRPRGKAALQAYILQGLPGIGPERSRCLIQRFGSVEAAMYSAPAALAEIPGIGPRIAGQICRAVEEPAARYVH